MVVSRFVDSCLRPWEGRLPITVYSSVVPVNGACLYMTTGYFTALWFLTGSPMCSDVYEQELLKPNCE